MWCLAHMLLMISIKYLIYLGFIWVCRCTLKGYYEGYDMAASVINIIWDTVSMLSKRLDITVAGIIIDMVYSLFDIQLCWGPTRTEVWGNMQHSNPDLLLDPWHPKQCWPSCNARQARWNSSCWYELMMVSWVYVCRYAVECWLQARVEGCFFFSSRSCQGWDEPSTTWRAISQHLIIPQSPNEWLQWHVGNVDYIAGLHMVQHGLDELGYSRLMKTAP